MQNPHLGLLNKSLCKLFAQFDLNFRNYSKKWRAAIGTAAIPHNNRMEFIQMQKIKPFLAHKIKITNEQKKSALQSRKKTQLKMPKTFIGLGKKNLHIKKTLRKCETRANPQKKKRSPPKVATCNIRCAGAQNPFPCNLHKLLL